jgi:hypothetical protein
MQQAGFEHAPSTSSSNLLRMPCKNTLPCWSTYAAYLPL